MAKVIDARRNGGELVILGKHLTLPADDSPVIYGAEPLIASVRYDPETDAIQAFLLVGDDYQWCPVGISRGAHKVMYADGSEMTGPLIMTGAQILADKGITAAPGISFAAQPGDGFYLNPQQEFSASARGKHVLRIMPDGLYVVEDIHANRVFAVEVNGHQGNFDNLLVRVHAEINDQTGNTAFIKHVTANLIDTVPADLNDKSLVAQAEFITQGANWQITHENDHRLNFTFEGTDLVTFSDGGTVTAEIFHGGAAFIDGTLTADHIEANSAHIAQGLSADNITANTVTVNVRTQSDTYIGNHVSITGETVTGTLQVNGAAVANSLVVNGQTQTNTLVANGALVYGQTQTGSLAAGSAHVSGDTTTGTLAVAASTTTDTLVTRLATVSDTLQATHVRAGDAQVTGQTSTGSLSTGSAEVSGQTTTSNLVAGSAQVTGPVQAASLAVSGATQTGSLATGTAQVTGAAQAGSLSVSGATQTGSLTVTGPTALNTLTAHTISADAATVSGAVQAASFSGVSATLSGVVQAQGLIGQSGAFFGGDIASCFTADAVYDVGTVLKLGGAAEVTIANALADADVIGVVSSAQGVRLNVAGETIANAVYITSQGRTAVKAIGPIWKGDPLVSAGQGQAGLAQSANGITVPTSAIIGRALQDLPGANVAVITIKV